MSDDGCFRLEATDRWRGDKMPILRKNGQSIYFVQLPCIPINSFYLALLDHGYSISNLGPLKGDMYDQKTKFSEALYERHQIRSFQKEGEFKYLTGSPQFATYVSWCHWGPFDYSVAVLRDPMERFAAAVRAVYQQHLKKKGLEHGTAVFQAFQIGMVDYLQNRLPKKQYAYENAFRSMMPYLLPQTRLRPFTPDGMAQLSRDLGLPTIDYDYAPGLTLTFPPLLEYGRKLYEEDIAFYLATFGEGDGA